MGPRSEDAPIEIYSAGTPFPPPPLDGYNAGMNERSEKPTVAFWIVVVLTVVAFLAVAVVLVALFWPSETNPFIYPKE
jgi:hypothetical protein